MRKDNRTILVAMLMAQSWLSGSAFSAEVSSEVGVGVGVTNNVSRVPSDGDSEVINLLGFGLTVFDDEGTLQTNSEAQLEYQRYVEGTYDGDWIGGVDSVSTIVLAQDRLRWNVQDNYGQNIVDPLTPERPDNRENVNVFSTGPVVNLLSGGRNRAEVEFRYSQVDFDQTPNSSSRYLTGLSLSRDVRRGSTLSLVVDSERIEFDEHDQAADYDRQQGFLRWEIIGARNTLGVDGGYTRIDLSEDERSGSLWRLSWHVDLSPFSGITVLGGTRFSDQGNIFRFYQQELGDLDVTPDVISDPEPFRNNFFSTSYTLNRQRTRLEVSVSWDQADYSGSDIDRDVVHAELVVEHDFSRRFFSELRLRGKDRDYKYLERSSNRTSGSVILGYRFTPWLNLSMLYQRFERNADQAIDSFVEDRVFLRVLYTPEWGR